MQRLMLLVLTASAQSLATCMTVKPGTLRDFKSIPRRGILICNVLGVSLLILSFEPHNFKGHSAKSPWQGTIQHGTLLHIVRH